MKRDLAGWVALPWWWLAWIFSLGRMGVRPKVDPPPPPPRWRFPPRPGSEGDPRRRPLGPPPKGPCGVPALHGPPPRGGSGGSETTAALFREALDAEFEKYIRELGAPTRPGAFLAMPAAARVAADPDSGAPP